ncbi:MAG: tetratricopeptide repeat protein [Myxococcota bacterium]
MLRRALIAAALLNVGHASAQATLEDAVTHLSRGETTAAARALTEVTQQPEADPHAFLFLGAIQRDAGELAAAELSFQQGLTRDPAHRSLRLELATTQAWRGNLEAALHSYREVLSLHPTDTPARLGVARTLFWQGDHAEAAAAYIDVLDREDNNAEALVGLGDVRRSRLQRRSARALYRRALQLSQDNAEAAAGLRELDETWRGDIVVGAGVVVGPDADPAPRGSLGMNIQATPEIRLSGQVQQDVRVDDEGPVARRGTVLLAGRIHNLTLQGGYQLQRAEGRRVHRLLLAGAVVVQKWTLLASFRPGRRDDGRLEHMSSVGVQRALGGEAFVGATVFRADHETQRQTSVALSAGTALGPLRWRIDGSVSVGTARFGALGTGLWWQFHPRHALGLRADVLTLGWRTLVGARYQVRL